MDLIKIPANYLNTLAGSNLEIRRMAKIAPPMDIKRVIRKKPIFTARLYVKKTPELAIPILKPSIKPMAKPYPTNEKKRAWVSIRFRM